ncbi:hypothetical protein FQR65_LT04127 [Abscondita terminalis]|nr:hypothetical protein FQR65_LT04127 [Abscondita terminalis]
MFTNRRILYVKCIIILLLVYVFAYIFTTRSTSEIIRELQQSGRNLAALDRQQSAVDQIDSSGNFHNVPEAILVVPTKKSDKFDLNAPVNETLSNKLDPELLIVNKVREITKCLDKPLNARVQQRGDYWVLYNYVMAEKRHKCHESITYTTHADYSFLDNVLPLLERWQGPISVAVHAPGTDFSATIDSIAYLRDCTSPAVREFVTFHIYFSTKHVPKQVPQHDKVFQEPYNCSLTPPYFNVSADQMYKVQKKLLYPVNVGRNVARETAQTHYILASDIELYPSPDLIPQFLEMISLNEGPLKGKNPKVFPLHLFEVNGNQQVPDNKTMLKEMISNGTGFLFHKKLCPKCHNVPKTKEWLAANESKGLHVFHVGKRNGHFIHWEPIFIGTHSDPLYDERLSWEGKSDKMTQGYALCVLDYDFLILDNAFLVHKPGIKVYKKDQRRMVLSAKTNQLIKKIIFPELKVLYAQFNFPKTPSRLPVAPERSSSVNCPEKNGRFPLGACDAYIECEDGVGEEKLCPDGLLFNAASGIFQYPCQYPINVDCTGRASTQPAQPTDLCPHQYGGRGYIFDCPEGLAFNSATYSCDWPDLVPTCNAEAFLGFKCPQDNNLRGFVEEFRTFRSPTDCQRYFICVNAKPRLYNCGEGNAYNELTNACDGIENVTGCATNPRPNHSFIKSALSEQKHRIQVLRYPGKHKPMHVMENTENWRSYATICRLCMHRDGFMLGIFNHIRGKEKSIYRKIMDCTDLQISSGDGLPSCICHRCLYKIELCIEFKQQCSMSDATLRQINGIPAKQIEPPVSYEMPKNYTQDEDAIMVVDPLVLDYDSEYDSENEQQSDLENPELNDLYEFRNVFMCKYCDQAFTGKTECASHESTAHNHNVPYTCKECDMGFGDRGQYSAHLKSVHQNDKPYNCPQCERTFARRSDLRKHTIVHTGIKPFTCNICFKSFSRNTNLSKHMRIHSGQKPFVCPKCPKTFISKGDLTRHAIIHSGQKPFRCNYCHLSFGRRDKLLRHEKRHFPQNSEDKSQELEIMRQNLSMNDYGYKNDSENHVDGLPDPEKQDDWNNSENMIINLDPFNHNSYGNPENTPQSDLPSEMNHRTPIKTYRAFLNWLMQKSRRSRFGRRDKLLRHEKRHFPQNSEDKSQELEIMRQNLSMNDYGYKNDSENHVDGLPDPEKQDDWNNSENMIINLDPFNHNSYGNPENTPQSDLPSEMNHRTPIKTYRAFLNWLMQKSRRNGLQVHMSTHTAERPYNCNMCSKTFLRKRELDRHLATHTGMKPFKCPHCDKRFGRKDKLVRHIRIHDINKEHICVICGASFNRKDGLAHHMKTHARDNTDIALNSL